MIRVGISLPIDVTTLSVLVDALTSVPEWAEVTARQFGGELVVDLPTVTRGEES